VNTFTHGTIYVRPAVEGSTLLINKGRVLALSPTGSLGEAESGR